MILKTQIFVRSGFFGSPSNLARGFENNIYFFSHFSLFIFPFILKTNNRVLRVKSLRFQFKFSFAGRNYCERDSFVILLTTHIFGTRIYLIQVQGTAQSKKRCKTSFLAYNLIVILV